MQAFEYANATKKEQVAALLADQGAILAGGTDLLALMKDDVVTPKRLVNVKHIDGLRGVTYQPGNGLRIGALTTLAEISEIGQRSLRVSGPDRGGQRSRESADSQSRDHRRQHVPAPALLVLPQRHGTAAQD